MAAVGHFGCPKFTFDRISGHVRSIRNLIFFWNFSQNGFRRLPKLTFDCISGHFRSIGHFGCLKFTFDSNSGHFRSIQNFFFPAAILDVQKPLSITFLAISDRSAILDVRNWLSMAFLESIRIFFLNFWQNSRRWPFWMSENNFWSHFWPFQIDTQLLFFF